MWPAAGAPEPLSGCAGVAGLQCGPGKVEWRSIRAAGAEAALTGNALSMEALVAAMEELQHDIRPGDTPGVPYQALQNVICLLQLQTLTSCGRDLLCAKQHLS